ncbi:hypothetical protein GCM10011521_20160 [Arenimonas soli]|uniref:Acyl-CoA desaturase n=1 Tax=Arenimonas soli TaxID=2269504 RepID=A0ABQ1HL52_9GAMM|nr:hypothetical protein [Arenimonas soli]GGA81783.1 hypothetical protein GCM10011521_20160 [Arenimonas soli]
MNDHSIKLLPRAYAVRDANGRRRAVSVRDALRQYGRSLNFLADRRRTLHALFEASHLLMLVPTVVFFVYFANLATMLFFFAVFLFLANVTNTVWYHRYCSHRAFRFVSPLLPRICLWLNPLGYREEVYALVHHVHHSNADEENDPNGPQLGWLGNYIASYFEIDTDISEAQYERIKARLKHIGMPFSSYASFRRWGCVESIPHYLARWTLATVLWAALWYALGGLPLLMAWFAVQFCWHGAVRDFNFRGHGSIEAPGQVDGVDFDRSSFARNQRFYGLLAGEWHNNHHAFRASANSGFLPGQLDVPFQFIRLLKKCRLVSHYHDHRQQFMDRYADEMQRHRPELGGATASSN